VNRGTPRQAHGRAPRHRTSAEAIETMLAARRNRPPQLKAVNF
jgi:hypothetical protein